VQLTSKLNQGWKHREDSTSVSYSQIWESEKWSTLINIYRIFGVTSSDAGGVKGKKKARHELRAPALLGYISP
jgi:hypothetical protein